MTSPTSDDSQPTPRPAGDLAGGLLCAAARLGGFGAWSIDLQTGTASWSQQLDGIHGCPWTGECGSDELLALYAPESRAALAQAFTACARDGTPFDLEAQVLGAGERTWVRVLGVAIRDAAGRVVRVQGAYQDIERSKGAAERYRALAERFRSTLDSLADGFAIIDRGWRVTYANPAACAMLGIPQEQAVGGVYWDLLPGARGSEFELHFSHAMNEREQRRFEAYYAPLKMWFRTSVFPCEEGVAVSFSDITAARREHEALLEMNAELERRVRQRTEQLEAANSDLKAFSYSVAHDLRAPLASIAGYAQALEESREQQLGERSAHYLRRIRAAAHQMDAMTGAILSLFRVASAEIGRRQVDLATIARECLATLQAGAPARQVQASIEDELPAVADPTLIAIAMQNLLSNAWKYTAPQPLARIEVGARVHHGGLREFFVRDNGVGFEQAHAGRLFEPFTRLHGASFEGSGVGLATVHKIIARHGGRVWAESAPGQGATFFFTLG